MVQKFVNIHGHMCEVISEPCNTEQWRTDGRTHSRRCSARLTAGVQTLLSGPSWSQVTSTGGHSQEAVHKVSHVHVVRVRRARRLGLLLGLPPYEPVVVLQLLLPLLLVIHLLRASSLREKMVEKSRALFRIFYMEKTVQF